MNSSRSVRRVTGLLREFVGIDHGPAELGVALDIVTLTSLRSAPVWSRKRVTRPPTLSFTTIEDDPDIAPAFKVPAQLLVPV